MLSLTNAVSTAMNEIFSGNTVEKFQISTSWVPYFYLFTYLVFYFFIYFGENMQ